MCTAFWQKTQPNHFTSVQPMFGWQNGLTEDITQYAILQSCSDGDVPLYIVHPVISLNNLTKRSLDSCLSTTPSNMATLPITLSTCIASFPTKFPKSKQPKFQIWNSDSSARFQRNGQYHNYMTALYINTSD